MYVGLGVSTEKDPVLAVKEAAKIAAINMHGAKVDLAITFTSFDHAYPILLKTLNILLNRIPIIGLTGAAIMSNEGVFSSAVAVMLLGFPKGTYFNAACVKDIKEKGTLEAGRELGVKLMAGFQNMHRVLSVTFCDGLIEEGTGIINGLQERLGRSFPLIGASASDNLRFLKTYVYSNQEMINDAIVGILFAGKISFGLGLKHGWKPLGKPRTVTRAEGNVVYEINNQPAIKMYQEYLGRGFAELQREIKRISVLYPLGMFLPGEQEYLLRNARLVGDDGSLHMQGNVEEGSTVRLMIGTKESCLAATHQALEEAKQNLVSQRRELLKDPDINFLLVFDSVSRYMLLKRDADKELEIIKSGIRKDTPILGIYTYGEQAPLLSIDYQGQTHLHNQTITMLAVSN
ncbi:MAG: FIST N-terminal domain-containing protein [Candidatus Omnitrophica bacterium]|nr:FIST N-terminal domain-containing protein [Candidatus Omnitrophota bacterium]